MNRLDRFCSRTMPLLIIAALVVIDARLNAIADGDVTHAGQAGTINGTRPVASASPCAPDWSSSPGPSVRAGCHPLPPTTLQRSQTRQAAGLSISGTLDECVETESESCRVGGAQHGSTGALRAAEEPGIGIAKPPTGLPGSASPGMATHIAQGGQ